MKKGLSIHIGLNILDTDAYIEPTPLETCVQDALDMRDIAEEQNYEVSISLFDDEATSDNVINAIIEASKVLKKGDILFLTYSGHGTQLDDENSEEEDNYDEAWCLYDRPFLDDELNELWKLFEEDVRIFIISDSCHSGTISKDIFHSVLTKSLVLTKEQQAKFKTKGFLEKLKNLYSKEEKKEIKATVKLISGCQDEELSLILGDTNSLLTSEILKVWNSGEFIGTTDDFFEKVRLNVKKQAKTVKYKQNPKLTTIGKKNEAFNLQKPFSIYE